MARDITNAAFCTSEAGTFANTKTSQQQPAEWAAALHGFSAPSASRVGWIPNVMTTCHQSSSPKLPRTLFVLPDFLLWKWAGLNTKQEKMFIIAAGSIIGFLSQQLFLLGGGVFIYFSFFHTPAQLSLLYLVLEKYCRKKWQRSALLFWADWMEKLSGQKSSWTGSGYCLASCVFSVSLWAHSLPQPCDWKWEKNAKQFDWLRALSIKMKYSRRPASFTHTSLRFRLIGFVSVLTLLLPVEFKIELSGFQHLTARCDLLPFRIVKLRPTRLNVDYSCHK